MSREVQICAICGHGRRGEAVAVHLTHGICVHLCPTHRSPAYLRRDDGNAFAAKLEALWRAHGAATRQRLAALRTHRRQCIPPGKSMPGSYAWPELRREAERRYARGESPDEVIANLRDAHAAGAARAPSVRTMRRWFYEGRWRHDQRSGHGLHRRLPRVDPHGMMEDTALPLLAGLIFEDPTPILPETAGLHRRPRPNRRE